MKWLKLQVSKDETHHTLNGKSVYDARFHSVLKFHPPGLAAVVDSSGAYHIDVMGNAAYKKRFIRTFGFYFNRAAVESEEGFTHILPSGKTLYKERYLWCGNYQQNYSVVKDFDNRFFHIDECGKKLYLETYIYAGDFRDGYAAVFDGSGTGTHIDRNGKELHGKRFADLDSFHKGFARAKDERGWFHINKRGDELYSERFKSCEPFYNAVSRVEKQSGSFALINEQGVEISTINERRDNTFHQVSAELVSFWRFYTIDAACRLKLFDMLPNKLSILKKELSIHPNSTIKLLHALYEMDYVKLESETWHLTAKGAFLTSSHPLSLLDAQKLWKEEHLTAWSNIKESLKSGKSAFEHQFNMPFFDFLDIHPDKKALYHRALSVYAKYDYKDIPSKINFRPYQTLLDVGGSTGELLFCILAQHPHLKGILFDLPSVISISKPPQHLKARMEYVGGNFFEPWPDIKADCALLTRVIHDWGDEESVELLKKVSSVCDTLFIVESILKDRSGSLLNLNMQIMTGGRERRIEEFQTLFEAAGLTIIELIPLNEVSTIFVVKKFSSYRQ